MPKRRNCEICGQPIKVSNMEDHMKRVHPKQKMRKKGKKRRADLAKKDESEKGRTLWKVGAVAIIIVVVVAAVSVFLLGASPEEEEQTLLDTDGNTIRLSDWQGKPVLLDFMGSTCTECQDNTQGPLFQIRQNYGSSIRMLSISIMAIDTNEDLINHKTSTGANWQFALDSANLDGKYLVTSIPTVVVLDASGQVYYFHSGQYSYQTLSTKIDELLANPNRYKNFTVTDSDGITITLSDWEGDVILLDFIQTTCGHCQDNTNDTLVQIYNNYSTQIKMLSISIRDEDTNQDLENFKLMYGAQWQYALDTDGVKGKYGVSGTPTGFLIDRNGNIVYSHVGADDYDTLKSEIDQIL
jgi:peroxiredoxin